MSRARVRHLLEVGRVRLGDRALGLADKSRIAAAGQHFEIEGVLRAEDERRENLQVHRKGRVDLVTRVDHELQTFIVDEVLARHPEDHVVAEEGDRPAVDASPARAVWYVDPLDGTTNFVHGHPFFAVSIACWQV